MDYSKIQCFCLNRNLGYAGSVYIRVKGAYDNAIRSGRWGNSFATTNRFEFFAEATELWFEAIDTTGSGTISSSYAAELRFYPATHEDFVQREPQITSLIEEVFGNPPHRSKPARETLHLHHLEGYDHILTPQYDQRLLN